MQNSENINLFCFLIESLIQWYEICDDQKKQEQQQGGQEKTTTNQL